MSTTKIVLITVAASLLAGSFPLMLIKLFTVGGESNRLQNVQVQEISSSDYAAAENFTAQALSYDSGPFISYDDYQALPDDERKLRTITLTGNGSNALKDKVAEGLCTQEGQEVTCYEKLSEIAVLRNKLTRAAKATSLPKTVSSFMLDEMYITRDMVTGHSYGSNFHGDYTWEDLYVIDYDSATDSARILTPGSMFPTRSEAFSKHSSNFFVSMRYFDSGTESMIKFDLQVVNGQFYGVYGSPRDEAVVSEQDKGIFHYNSSTQQWAHLTSGIDYATGADSDFTPIYKIAKDGCTVRYKAKKKFYAFNACY
jgi:hypothetical protein